MTTNGSLSVVGIVQNGIELGVKNLLPLAGAFLLFILTAWIPYLNVGTYIGLSTLVAKIGRGESFSPLDIFNAAHRKPMGEFFLIAAFTAMGAMIGYAFLFIPGMVISIAWGQATLLVLDKGLDPIQAIHKSNDITYGKKWTIFLGMLLLAIAIAIALLILNWIGGKISPFIGLFFTFAIVVLAGPIVMGAQGYIYNALTTEENI